MKFENMRWTERFKSAKVIYNSMLVSAMHPQRDRPPSAEPHQDARALNDWNTT